MNGVPKVLLVGPAFSGGGAEGRFARIARAVLGGTAHIAVLLLPDEKLHSHGSELIDLRWRSRRSYVRIIWQLATHIRTHRYDVVMGFGMFPNLIVVAAAMLARTGSATIAHEISRPLRMLENSHKMKRWGYIWLQRIFLSQADVLTANSIDGLSELQQICCGFKGPTARLGNAIDGAALLRRASCSEPLPSRLSQRYIACVGRLDWMKRFDTVISAFALLESHTDTHLVIVGDGTSRRVLEALAFKNSVSERVHFTGALTNPLGIVQGATSLVIASEYEGFSNSALEAMLLGTPLVTSFCSSDARHMVDIGAALGFAAGNTQALAIELEKVLSSAQLRQSLRTRALEYATDHLLEPCVERYDSLLLETARSRATDSV